MSQTYSITIINWPNANFHNESVNINVYLNILVLPCPGLLFTVLPSPRTDFNPRPMGWIYLVDKVVPREVPFRHFSLPLSVCFHQCPVFIDSCITLTCLLTYLLTFSMEQSPSWKANGFSASQEIPSILWNLEVNYRIRVFPPPAPILSQLVPKYRSKSEDFCVNIS